MTASNDFLFATNSFPSDKDLSDLWSAAWGETGSRQFQTSLRACLAHVVAHHGSQLIGFAKIASDGDRHAFLLDPTVHPDFRHLGVGTRLVKTLAQLASDRGFDYLHVDFEPRLARFYRRCGFASTGAGLMVL